MKKFVKIILFALLLVAMMMLLAGCTDDNTYKDQQATIGIGNKLSKDQPTPTDIDYSLERYNLIRRAYWVNGQQEKSRAVICPVRKPLGYIVTFLEGVGPVTSTTVDGKISSLNSFLTPDTTAPNREYADWLPDVDGSYGVNDGGIFWFDVTGEYHEWNGKYHYSSSPFEIERPILVFKEAE